jgi:hypothetical protein
MCCSRVLSLTQMTAKGAFSKSDERGVKRDVVRGDGSAGVGHGLVVGLHDVRAGATLAVKAQL